MEAKENEMKNVASRRVKDTKIKTAFMVLKILKIQKFAVGTLKR